MQPVTTITGPAAPLLRDNIDTDIIIRVERLAGTTRESMGAVAFEAWRFLPTGPNGAPGEENPAFILNQPPFRGTPILLTGANFGCGSSREGAVWALMGMGLRCIIAEGFGDIFRENCFQNGLLPIVLPSETIRHLAAEPEAPITIDLARQSILAAKGEVIPFQIEPARRTALLEGLDEIGQTLRHAEAIAAFQANDRLNRPWIWLPEPG